MGACAVKHTHVMYLSQGQASILTVFPNTSLVQSIYQFRENGTIMSANVSKDSFVGS